MKCDICGIRDAVVFIQQISENAAKELHLCRECAEEKGISGRGDQLRLSLTGLLSDIMQNGTASAGKKCSVCGMSLADIKKNKRAGCAACYHTFRSEIIAVMDKDALPHCYSGSRPRVLAGFRSVLSERENLKRALSQAVAREDYETAAQLRDRLHYMTGGTADAQS